ncbi:hypothetical protein WAI453_009361 [Rhynchosporium graminicola]|uniref:Bis(5'-adenosyl)-triphosphatase n=1 Tax=Rhynchosporium graminicola TaxID=2792576 RepID=A0A1E1LI99_9HELO|nr:related to bis(5`-nucleosyl)-tetraphosphatase (asymmetrical) [Rhynchosporium commune]
MTSQSPIHFGPYEVTNEVFYKTSLCYALVNIKPILPGHVLIIPFRQIQYLSELSPAEVTDVFATVQKVQRMLSLTYGTPDANIAIQNGVGSGQTVQHFHCHIIPREKGNTEGDTFYLRLQGEEGNVGGKLFDRERRPETQGKFPQLKDEDRHERSKEEMRKEASFFAEQMKLVE